MAKAGDCRVRGDRIDVPVENLAGFKCIDEPVGLVYLPPWRRDALSRAEKRLTYVKLPGAQVNQMLECVCCISRRQTYLTV